MDNKKKQQPKAWEEKLFKDLIAEEIAKGKTPEEQEQIKEKICIALMGMNCSGLQGRR